jgi:pimeloyl-ACP methyl ester carboxylesterase
MRLEVAGSDVYAYTGMRPFDPAQATVLFVHGAAHDHSVFALQSRYFAHHGRNVLAVDLPAHGRSAGVPLASVEAIANWLAAVLDAAGVRKAALVGHSLGSLAVLEAAARHPPRIERIALLGPAVPMLVSDVLLAAAREDAPSAYEMINGWSHSPARQLGGNPVPGMWMTGAALALMARSRNNVLDVDLRACNDYGNGLRAAAAVACSALVVLAARDLMAPPKAAQALIAGLPQPKVVTLPDCGHAMMTEQPDAVLDALRAFI